MNDRQRLKEILLEKSYRQGSFTLTSGKTSDFYIDGKQTTLSAEGAYLCGKLILEMILRQKEPIQAVGGMTLGADPLVTIGSATVNSPVLSNLKDAAALREMTMGRAVAQAAFHRDVRHFAYPFGDRAAFARKHVQMAEDAGFVSAASALPGVVQAEGRTNLHALPRLSWDGRQRSLRVMRVLLSGAAFAPVAPTRSRIRDADED